MTNIDNIRRLTPEMCKTHRREIDANALNGEELCVVADNALHDLDVLERELAAARATIAQQGAVIEEMREALTQYLERTGHYLCKREIARYDEYGVMRTRPVPCNCGYDKMRDLLAAGADKLAADHDASVRRPLEEQIASLREALDGLIAAKEEWDGDPNAWPSREQVERWLEAAQQALDYSAEAAEEYTTRIQAEARADERRKVLDAVEEAILAELHEAGCPAIADDESDSVLADFQECACHVRPFREKIRALAAPPEEEKEEDHRQ